MARIAWPLLFALVFALTRIPGLLPPNFSAAYAFAFCAGVFFRGALAWWLPLGTLALTDLALTAWYAFGLGYDVLSTPALLALGFNYVAYAALILLGRCFKPHSSLLTLLGGGLLGAILFYLITNTAAWWFNPFGHPEYTRTLQGWLRALTLGASGWPPTWEFFRNTLLSSGLFTALFSVAARLTAPAESPAEKDPLPAAQEPEESAEPEGGPQPA
ncbi:DUF6580 family putative transport protein [Limisphaera sp. 4302-co]|uniref:DUF6580 family putative transport protein n=1 Tax=Limisphaera sp. 4302-co TaxID=3400417 RepID=UPI003C1BEB4B